MPGTFGLPGVLAGTGILQREASDVFRWAMTLLSLSYGPVTLALPPFSLSQPSRFLSKIPGFADQIPTIDECDASC